MSVDGERWRRQGRGVRSLEAVQGSPTSSTRADAADAVLFVLMDGMRGLSTDDRAAALAYAVEGYVTEHLARGGVLEG